MAKLEKDVQQLEQHEKSLQVLQDQLEALEKTVTTAADQKAVSALQEHLVKVDARLAQTIAKGGYSTKELEKKNVQHPPSWAGTNGLLCLQGMQRRWWR